MRETEIYQQISLERNEKIVLHTFFCLALMKLAQDYFKTIAKLSSSSVPVKLNWD